MKISVSQLKRHRSCPMLAHYEYDMLKAPAGQIATALLVGTVVHKAFEALLMGGDWHEAAQVELRSALASAANDGAVCAYRESVEQWEALELAIGSAWETPKDWEIISVEEELELHVGGHILVGRLDSIVRWNGGLWHLQHKTMPTNKVVAVFAEQQRTDWHESVYQRMGERRFGEPFAGTLLNCIRKLSRKAAVEKPLTAFESFFLPRSEEEVNEALADIEQEINDIQDEHEGKKRIIKNRSFCAGAYGNKVCAFKDVCDNRADINDTDRFVTVEARYSDTSTDV